jgi:hypothetical protein
MYMTVTYHSYLLRMWLESSDPPVWRAILVSPISGEQHGFASLQTLFAFLKQEAEHTEDEALSALKKSRGDSS